MVQKINPHPAPGCNRSSVFSCIFKRCNSWECSVHFFRGPCLVIVRSGQLFSTPAAQGLFYFTIFYQYRFPLSQSHQSVHCLSVVEREYFILAHVHHNVDQNIFEIVFEFNKHFIPRYFLTVFQIKLVING